MPKEAGRGYQLSPTLKAIKEHREDFTVLTGLGHPQSQGGHSGADTWLTAANLKAKPGQDYTNTVSVDQLAASVHGKKTRFPSLQLSDMSETGSAGHSHTLSFDVNGTPLPAGDSPRRLFERLFVPETLGDRNATLKRYAEGRSILDDIAGEARARTRRLAPRIRESSTSTSAASARQRSRSNGCIAG